MSNRYTPADKERTSDNQQKRIKRYMARKLIIVFFLIMLVFAVLFGRVVYFNYTNGDAYSKTVLDQQTYSSTTIPYKRGTILDRNGNVLAQSIMVYNLVLDPAVMLSDNDTSDDNDHPYYDATIEALVNCFGYDETELREKIESNSNSRYVVYEKTLEYYDIQDFLTARDENAYIQGVWFEEKYERRYPYTTLAATVLGFVDTDGSASYGLEGYYNDVLTGVNGREYGYVDEDNNMEKVVKAAEDGSTLVSTLDVYIQSIVEKYIAEWDEIYDAKNIGVIISDPNTNEIYAMATDTVYDPNNPRDLSYAYTEEEIAEMSDAVKYAAILGNWNNFCVYNSYEPGSTYKPIVSVAVLEENLIDEDVYTYECDGYNDVGIWHIKCNVTTGHGVLNLQSAIALSCNDFFMEMGALLGPDKFLEYQLKFGFGQYTGIDLSNERSCSNLVYSSDTLNEVSLAISSFGQGFNVTMIQMASAFSSIINGGYYYKPHVVSEIINSSGGVEEYVGSEVVRITCTRETSDYLKQALYLGVTEGSGIPAQITGYKIGGKTGTAQVNDRESENYVYSFIGFVADEDDNPLIQCYVVVDECQTEEKETGSFVASRLFKAIMEEVLPYLNIYPTEME